LSPARPTIAAMTLQAQGAGAGRSAATTRTVLLVVPDEQVCELLAAGLRRAGCFALPATRLEQGDRLAAQVLPDLIVVDVDGVGPEGPRWAAAQAQRCRPRVLPTVVIVGRDASRVDGPMPPSWVVAKPVDPRGFVQGVMHLLRAPRAASRPRPRARAPLRLGALEVERDAPTLRLRRGGRWRALDLPPTEHRLLLALLADQPRVSSREALRLAVWGDEPVALRTVDQYVRRLRSSLREVGAREIVSTVASFGYRIDIDALDAATPA
jgi:two-component system phosphate regulon response regulator PhoB